MRREHFTAAVREADTGVPALQIEYDGPDDGIVGRFTDADGNRFAAQDIDAALRLQDPPEDDDVTGVFSLTHRLTGEYLLEVNVSALEVISLAQSAREDGDGSYRVHVDCGNDTSIGYDLTALFVYDPSGELLRQRSLIPSGVEL
jgi:hypothetical protein